MKELVAQMKRLVLDSEPNVYYDEMMAVVKKMEDSLNEKTVSSSPKSTPTPPSAQTSVEETVAKAVVKKTVKKAKTEVSTEE